MVGHWSYSKNSELKYELGIKKKLSKESSGNLPSYYRQYNYMEGEECQGGHQKLSLTERNYYFSKQQTKFLVLEFNSNYVDVNRSHFADCL